MNSNQQLMTIMDAIAVDETGLSFGILGTLRLKSVFQPIFARRGSLLVPVAMSAALAAQQGGRQVGEAALENLSAPEQRLAEGLGRSLAIRNLAHIGCEDPDFDLVLGFAGEAETVEEHLEMLVETATLSDVRPERLWLDLTAMHAAPCFATLVKRLDMIDAPLVLDLEAASRRWPGSAMMPRLVRIPPAWTRAMVAEPDLLRLFRLLVTTLRQRGALVQVEGIADEVQLRAALTAGADRLQGDFLAGSALAGTEFDASPRAFADLIGGGGNVVPLSA